MYRGIRHARRAMTFMLIALPTFSFLGSLGFAGQQVLRTQLRVKVEHFQAAAQDAAGQYTSTVRKWQARLVLVDERELHRESTAGRELVTSQIPKFIAEESGNLSLSPKDSRITELVGSRQAVLRQLSAMGISQEAALSQFKVLQSSKKVRLGNLSASDELRTLVDSGPVENRIDLVFMGDGYTEAERERFFEDIQRLTNDLFASQTFSAYLPLFNVHAVFRASAQSGIGKGKAADTAYGLYREGNTLRAIFPSKEDAIRDSCGVAPDCDYPVVVANDDYYGGLGGEFAITTRSKSSGTVVLRHELGHNFGKVGEEYDGGGYFGANYSERVKQIGWKKWLSEEPGKLKPAPQVALALGWPWKNISSESFQQPFKSDGRHKFTAIRLSLSGLAGPGAYSVLLDGVPLEEKVLPSEDRSFVDFRLTEALAKGDHVLEVKAFQTTGNEYLSSMTVHEYANDPDAAPDTIGAFPVFSRERKVEGYRPTDERCLMRNMLHPWFCPVCQENNWRQLLGAIKLHDAISATGSAALGNVAVELSPIGLGQFRSKGAPRNPGQGAEHLGIAWLVNGLEVPAYKDLTKILLPEAKAGDRVTARLSFVTSEIRNDDKGFTQDEVTLSVQ